MEADRLLEGLDPDQRAAVTSEAAPLCILAGAGSGKTRVLTRRIAYRVATGTADARHVLALTFTRKAAGELGARLGALGVRDQVVAGTFHAVAYAQLRRRWADSGGHVPALLDRKARLLARLMGATRAAGVQPADIAAEIEWAKARMVPPARYAAEVASAGRKPPMAAPSVAALYERYEEERRRRRLVDFDDLLLLCLSALDSDADFAAGQRWRFRHLFVDEFQDVNPLQHRLLEAWRGGRDDLCVVGDPNQAIYSWNGADAGLLTGFTARHPAADVVRLDRNYRSTPQVLTVANAVLAGGDRDAPALRATRPAGPVPAITSYATDLDEARGIARALRARHAGPALAWSSMAVLSRTHAQGVLVAEALEAAGVPYRIRGGPAFLELPEIREALRDLDRDARRVPLLAALADVEETVRGLTGAEGDGGGQVSERLRARRANLETLVRLGHEYAAVDATPTADGFLAWLSAAVRGDGADRSGDAVEIVTFHAAKGLEWPVVFLAGLERGLVPIGHADTAEARAEERRLLYVAITRAEEELHCSWAEQRTFGSRTATRQPSPYLADVEAAIAALTADDVPADWGRFLAGERARLMASDGGRGGRRGRGSPRGGRSGRDRSQPADDSPVLEALKAWRTTAARAAGVPAYVVFHDSTLEAVAEAEPSDRETLLGLPGVGPVKIARYGEALLAVVAQHRAS